MNTISPDLAEATRSVLQELFNSSVNYAARVHQGLSGFRFEFLFEIWGLGFRADGLALRV